MKKKIKKYVVITITIDELMRNVFELLHVHSIPFSEIVVAAGDTLHRKCHLCALRLIRIIRLTPDNVVEVIASYPSSNDIALICNSLFKVDLTKEMEQHELVEIHVTDGKDIEGFTVKQMGSGRYRICKDIGF